MDQKDLLVSSQVISCHTGIISKAGICNIIQHKSVSSKSLFDADLKVILLFKNDKSVFI